MLTFTKEEKELLTYALMLRRNYIETGNGLLSSADVYAMKKDGAKVEGEVRPLSVDQMKLILQIEDLIERITKS